MRLKTVSEAAAETRLSKSLLYELCRLGRLKHYRVGARGKGRILIALEDLEEFLNDSRVEPSGESEGDEDLTYLT